MANKLRITNKVEPLGVWACIPSDSINSVTIEFEFCEDWKDLLCVAQFSQNENTYNQVIENNKCVLPSEVVTGALEISVFGTKTDGTAYRETSIPFCTEIVKSGFSSTAETPIPPTPDLYEQLIEKFTKEVGVTSINAQKGDIDIVGEDNIEVVTDGTKIKLKSKPVTIDSEMSDASENPVQNKVVKQYVDDSIDELGTNFTDVLSDEILPDIDKRLDTIEGGTVSGNVEFTGEAVISTEPTVDTSITNKLYVDTAISGATVTIDSEMSDASENPVQNKVVKQYVDDSIPTLPTNDYGKLIYNTELSEDVSGVTITVDNDGNNISLRKAYIVLNIPADTTLNALSYLAVQLSVKGTKYPLVPFNSTTVVSGGTSGKYWQIIVDLALENNGWKFIEGTRKDAGLDTRLYQVSSANMGFIRSPYVSEYSALLANKILLAPSGASGGRVLPIGTIVEIFGITDDVSAYDVKPVEEE